MPTPVTLKATRGCLKGKEFAFNGKTVLTIGRHNDCDIILPDDTVSRHHCLLYIDPPFASVQDLHNLNGTYLNGKRISNKGIKQNPNGTSVIEPEIFSIKNGDRLGIGKNNEFFVFLPLFSAIKDAAEFKDYNFLGTLGKGETGYVWRVEEKRSKKQFALKLACVEAGTDDRIKKMLYREAVLASQLIHPNIVRQHKSGEFGGMFYFLQEICPGGSAQDLMERQKGEALSTEKATHIILQVLSALSYAHTVPLEKHEGGKKKNGFVHRDIKPGNILLTDSSSLPGAKLCDFGKSRIFDLTRTPGDLTRPGEVGGTPAFTCWQQIINYRDSKPEVDIWAAAASYFYMLTGEAPKDLRYGNRWKQAAISAARPIRSLKPDIPKKLARVIDHALIDEPEILCKSAAELKQKIINAF